jgi:hypothetical protein
MLKTKPRARTFSAKSAFSPASSWLAFTACFKAISGCSIGAFGELYAAAVS